MRWTMKNRPAEGNVVGQWFALWPFTVGGETRWLEWVAVEFRTVITYGDGGKAGRIHKHAVRFIS
ncbi:MAG: hypothetical protein ACK6CT_01345 [Planctomycetia bacterium]|jgi:hypothetical protein